MDSFAENRNFYLASVGYINATQMLANSMKIERVLELDNELRAVQLWPLYHLLTLSGEFVLKACLTACGQKPRLWMSVKRGHDLEFLSEKFEQYNGNLDVILKSELKALNQGEYRYFKAYGGTALINIIDHNDYLNGLRGLSKKYNDLILKEKIK